MKTISPRLELIASMAIFGTIGVFVEYIPLPSGAIAFARGALGTVCLLIYALVSGTGLSAGDIKKNLPVLLISGAAIGFNWIFLFEAYRYTTVATATLCYYMAPVFVLLVSPVVFKEKLTVKQGICILVSLAGMVLVSGVTEKGAVTGDGLTGILFGLAAALLYATVIILNKKIGGISSHNKTTVQLAAAAIVVLPYTLLAEDADVTAVGTVGIILLLVVGIVHTGIAYVMYFGAVKALPARTVALLCYIDPVVAILLSAIVLKQGITLPAAVGAVLIFSSALLSELKKE